MSPSAADAVPVTVPDSSGAAVGWEALPSLGGAVSLELVRRYRTRMDELRAVRLGEIAAPAQHKT
eukprot:3098988-Alexandrium_andersonii.AAC.1